jgi:hypothetical protein
MPNIAVVSTIPYTSNTNYKNALEHNVSGVTFLNAKDDLGDDPTALGTAVHDIITVGDGTGAKPDYIVTLGGVNAYNAAANTTNNPSTPFFRWSVRPRKRLQIIVGGVSH